MPFLRARLCIVIETIQIIQEVLEEKSFSVKEIFKDNWSSYLLVNKVRDVESKEVEKMLSCKGIERGCFVFHCNNCGRNSYEFKTLGVVVEFYDNIIALVKVRII